MKLKLNNIGNFSNAEVEFKKITVFAGKNSTGKSTILKSVEFLSNSMDSDIFLFFLDRYFIRELTGKITEWFELTDYSEFNDNNFEGISFADEELENDVGNSEERKILEIRETVISKVKIISRLIHAFDFSNALKKFKDLIDSLKSEVKKFNTDKIDSEIDDVIDTFFDESNIKYSFLTFIYTERIYKRGKYPSRPTAFFGFDNKFSSLSVKKEQISGTLSLTDENEEVSITLNSKGYDVSSYEEIVDFKLENLSRKHTLSVNDRHNHRMRMFQKEKYDFEGIIDNKETKDVIKMITTILEKNVAGLNVNQFSAGMKTFDTLRKIRFSLFKNGGFLIFDEAESSLDPEYQLQYAEMVVLLAKSKNINIIISSHSAYFLEAIELYTRLYDLNKNANFYLTYNDENEFKVKNVNKSLEEFYNHFVTPFSMFGVLREKISEKEE